MLLVGGSVWGTEYNNQKIRELLQENCGRQGGMVGGFGEMTSLDLFKPPSCSFSQGSNGSHVVRANAFYNLILRLPALCY